MTDLVPVWGTRNIMLYGRMPREGNKTQRTTGTLHSLPHVGQGSDTGGGEQPPPMLPQV